MEANNEADRPTLWPRRDAKPLQRKRHVIGATGVPYIFELYEKDALSNYWYRLVIYPENYPEPKQEEEIRNGVRLTKESALTVVDVGTNKSTEVRILGGYDHDTKKPWYKVWRFDPTKNTFLWNPESK
jgi:hypothetical protein